MSYFKTLAIVDDIHTCDCCGKSNLKSTVAMEREDGEIVHFGSVCATRHSGRDSASIRREADAAVAARKAAADEEYKSCPERLAYEAKLAEARRANISPGREFAAYVREASMAARAAESRIAGKYGIKPLLG